MNLSLNLGRGCGRAALAVLSAALVFASCSGDAEPAQRGLQAGELKRREPTRVRVAPVEQREMVRVLQTTTVVDSDKEIEIFPRASGVVTEIHVDEGDTVVVGQVLAVLDQRQASAMVEQARVEILEARDAISTAEIRKREAESQIHQNKIAWEQAVRDYERNEKAALISQQALDALRTARDTRESDHQGAKLAAERAVVEGKAAETALKKAELALERAELELSYTRVEAPIAGIIAMCGVRIGATVGRGTSVIETRGAAFVITDLDRLRAVIHRPQRELAWFLGAPAPAALAGDGPQENSGETPEPARAIEIRATAEALPGVEFRGEIDHISPSIDPQSGSFHVAVRLEPAKVTVVARPLAHANAPANGGGAHPARGARLLPGMLVRLEIITDRHPQALVVPKRALRREGEIGLVFAVRDGHVRRIEVEEGFSDDVSVEILRREGLDLSPGDLVVVVGNRELEDGAEVVVEEKPAPETPEAPVAPAPELPEEPAQADPAPDSSEQADSSAQQG